eukprot:2408141-Rhodomonas_salina.2
MPDARTTAEVQRARGGKLLRTCYGMSGTELAYGATKDLLWDVRSAGGWCRSSLASPICTMILRPRIICTMYYADVYCARLYCAHMRQPHMYYAPTP